MSEQPPDQEVRPVTNEQHESIGSVTLSVLPPAEPDGFWRIEFSAATGDEAFAYNGAIREVMRAAKLIPYETTGTGNEANNEPGLHSWTANPSHRNRITSAEQLEKLLPDIHRAAQARLDLLP